MTTDHDQAVERLERELHGLLDSVAVRELSWPSFYEDLRRRNQRHRRRASVAAAAFTAAAVGAVLLLVVPGVQRTDRSASPEPSFSPHPTSAAVTAPAWANSLPGEVAYKCGDSICLMTPNGQRHNTLLATTPEWDPAWSPDGRRLAFRGYFGSADGDYAIYVVDATGCHPTELKNAMNGITPTWSPDGKTIAYAIGGINVINADGTHRHAVTRPTSRHLDSSPAWSATNKIAFSRYLRGTGVGNIYTMNADGSDVTALTTGNQGYDYPAWSADGRLIAFVSGHGIMPNDDARVIQVANANGSHRHPVTPATWTSYSPTWTPDNQIVFLVARSSHIDAYIVHPDGSHLRKLYPNLSPQLSSTEIAWGNSILPTSSC